MDTSGAGGWFYIADSDECLYISKRPNTWENAVFECLQRASLLGVLTAQNAAPISQKVSQYSTGSVSTSTQYWIGLRVVNPALQSHEWIDLT